MVLWLEPTLECRKFLTVFHDAHVETYPGLLALAYAVSILQEINPALREFEDSENMINHYNKLKETSIIANRLCLFQIVMCLTDES